MFKATVYSLNQQFQLSWNPSILIRALRLYLWSQSHCVQWGRALKQKVATNGVLSLKALPSSYK